MSDARIGTIARDADGAGSSDGAGAADECPLPGFVVPQPVADIVQSVERGGPRTVIEHAGDMVGEFRFPPDLSERSAAAFRQN